MVLKIDAWNNEIIYHRRIKRKKSVENVSSSEIVELFFVQCNLVDNQCQGKSEVLFIFTPNNFYGYLLNVEPSNLVFLKSYNTEFHKIIMTINWKTNLIWHCLLMNRNDTIFSRTKNKKIC